MQLFLKKFSECKSSNAVVWLQTTGYLQDLIYKLSKVGQAIDKDDLPAASSVLGPTTDSQWVRNINAVFSKVSLSSSILNCFPLTTDSLLHSLLYLLVRVLHLFRSLCTTV
jgi:hypothetical protein